MIDTNSLPLSAPNVAGTPNKQWNDSLHNLERELELYRSATAPGATQEEIDLAAERLATAARSIRSSPAQDLQDVPPSYQTPVIPADTTQIPQTGGNTAPYTQQYSSGGDGSEMRGRTADKHSIQNIGRDSAMKDVSRGFMLVLTAPVALAGMSVYACGTILEGTAMILKGAGSISRKPMDNARAALTGRKPSRK
ncbi:hypothetical protein HYPSUDRAFT_220027 [Hypholoma sublateritium FD-334 SS-4]|uniref:Uncharacterized protein n=1 Tax=Hypholoma sublateritium (strain FD-334 SS-4) TaxID=945553 RepID=A0A0D2N8N1_HYPSF|nr:hypothetical protein HYPSUDRAFT_220027 [Hypholoma sublateritium FD-334 SS-4]